MTPSKIVYLIVIFLTIQPVFFAGRAAEWIKLRSPHFEIYSSQPEANTQAALLHLERLHNLFRANEQDGEQQVGEQQGARVRVVLFSGFNEFGYYSPGGLAKAYFTYQVDGDLRREYLVLSGFDKEVEGTINHEFSHLVSHENGWRLPLWMEEGLAGYYETLEFRDGAVVTGGVHEKHLKMLRRKDFPLTGMTQLFQIGPEDRRRGAGHTVEALYVQGWAVVHLLSTHPKYRERFPEFFRKVAKGGSTYEALASVYQTTPSQLREDFLAHIEKPASGVQKEKTLTAVDAASFTRVPMEAWEGQLALTELLLTIGKWREAETEFETMRRAHPRLAAVDDGLSELKERRGEKAMAIRYCRSAIEKGSTNPRTYLRLAELQEGADVSKAFLLLDDAVKRSPENWQLRQSALQWAMRFGEPHRAAQYAGRFEEARANASYDFHFAAGAAQLESEHPEEALQFARRAQELATEKADKKRAEDLIAQAETAMDRRRAANRVAEQAGLAASADEHPQLAVPAPPPEVDRSNDVAVDTERINQTMRVFVKDRGGKMAQGVLKELRCGRGAPMLIVSVEGKLMGFAIDDPGNILITNAGGHEATHDFRCGRQGDERVQVGYQPAAQGASAGFVRILQFQ